MSESAEPMLKDPEEDETADGADGEEETSTPDAEGTTSDGDYEVAMADQSEVGDPDGFFDGVDADPDDGTSTDAGQFFDGEDGGSSSESSGGSSSDYSPGPVAERANKTIGKLGVFGLEEDGEKESLESEFVELAETVGFGSFTERSMEKHLQTTDFEDIDPVWGMVGAALILAAAIVYKRPDIDQEVIQSSLSGTLGSLSFFGDE